MAGPTSPQRIGWRSLGASLAALAWLFVVATGPRAAQREPTAPDLYHALMLASEDDPRAALADAQRRHANETDPGMRFWLLLATGGMYTKIEDHRGAQEAFAKAESTLASVREAGAHLSLWLQVVRIPGSFAGSDPKPFASRMVALRARVNEVGDPVLSCALTSWEQWSLVAARHHDEAWLATEELERCARAVGNRPLEAKALAGMLLLKSVTAPPAAALLEVSGLYERALAALDGGSARWRHSAVEGNMGDALRRLGRFDEALEHLRRSLSLSRTIDDRGGIGLTDVAIAKVQLERGALDEMLPLLAQAQELLEPGDDGWRMPEVMELRILALARMKRPEVLAEIDRARAWDLPTLQPIRRAPLVRAIAEGYAAQGQHPRAYAELRRANALEAESRRQAADTQALRLQARYDTVRREAENTELRLRHTAAQLQLEALDARQTALWVAVAALVLLAGGAGFFGRRERARGRAMRAATAVADEAKLAAEQARAAAEDANRAKSRFLAAASHDLRQPMHALNLYLGMMATAGLPPDDQRTYLARAQACGDTMEEMFRAFLDISRLEAGAVRVRIETFPVAELFRQLDLEFGPLAREKGIDLGFVASSVRVTSDADLVTNILRNLLGNALRYTDRGRIRVGCRRTRSSVRILVIDTGCGISREAQPHIFEEFYRGNGNDEHRSHGLGLGLAITRRLADLLQAPLTFSSRPGEGSAFMVELPRADGSSTLRPASVKAGPGPAASDLRGVFVVVVDDDRHTLEAMRTGLGVWGCEVLAAASTGEALRLLAGAERVPDVLLCDYRLGEDTLGLETVVAIRNEFAIDIPAIIITGDTGAVELSRIAASGLPILHKPLQWGPLKQAIADCHARR